MITPRLEFSFLGVNNVDSRERVFLALDHQEPDRVPRDFWATAETIAKLTKRLDLPDARALWDHFDIDLRYIAGPKYIGPPLEIHADGSDNDIWGVPRKVQMTGAGETLQSYKAVTAYPLAKMQTVEQLDEYAYWPSPDWFDYSVVRAQAQEVRAQGRVSVFMGDRLNRIAQFKPLMYLRGIEQAFVDIAIEEEMFVAVRDRLVDFYRAYTTRILEAAQGAIDIVCTGDDFGQQNGMLCSLPAWQHMLRPGFEEFIRIIHSADTLAMHHTCGSIYGLLPDFVECGLDILQALQPSTHEMDYAAIKAQFGNRLCFQGAVGIQNALPFGTPQDVDAEVKARIEALAPGGGYIISTSHNIQGDVSTENVLALIAAYDKYGAYA